METNPGTAVVIAVDECLAIAATWLVWDGRPRLSEDGDRVYTPHKAVRRIGDHLVDHLAEVEALLAGVPTQARERLTRLARTFELRLAAAGPDAWDVPRTPNWSLAEIADHLTGVRWYAEQLGRLS
jgi:hypothetical protein